MHTSHHQPVDETLVAESGEPHFGHAAGGAASAAAATHGASVFGNPLWVTNTFSFSFISLAFGFPSETDSVPFRFRLGFPVGFRPPFFPF